VPDTITKILFRRGLDIVRRTGGGDGVYLNIGEPGYNIDTKRLYMGDGLAEAGGTIGGTPVGIKMHGIFPTVIDVYNNIDASTAAALSAGGTDIGDFIFDSTSSLMYYVSAKAPNAELPQPNQFQRISLIGSVSSYNGISSSKNNVSSGIYVTSWLDPLYFTVGASKILLNQNTQVGESGNTKTFVVWGDITTNGALAVTDQATFNTDVNIGGDVTIGGIITVFPYTNGNTSSNWFSSWSTLNGLSGVWNATTASFNALVPFPFDYNHTTKVISTNEPNTAQVGINVVSTLVGLAVRGVDTLTTALSVQGSILATGDVIVFSTSDESLKKNIEVIPNALDKVCQLRGVTFDWDCSFRTGRDAGVIAQDVEKVLPEIVEMREDGTKAVKYDGVIPLLVEAIKELNKKIK
jgi:hypothetical protein